MKSLTMRSLSHRMVGWVFVLVLMVLWEIFGRLDTSGLFPPLSEVLEETVDVLLSEVTDNRHPAVGGQGARRVRRWAPRRQLRWEWCSAGGGLWSRGPPPRWSSCAPSRSRCWSRSPSRCTARPTPMKIGIIALGAFWAVLLNTVDGIRRVEPGYVESARVYTNGSNLEILRRVALPAAAPQIAVGLRIGLAISLIVMVVSEMFGASSGLGYLILQSQRLYALTSMYAGVIILAVIGLLLTALFSAAEKRAMFWFDGMKGRTS